MTAAKAKAEAAPKPFTLPEGFVQGGTPDVDGWYKPQLPAEDNNTVIGKIVGSLRINGENGKRDVILVKLREPCKGYQKSDETGAILEQGKVLAVGVTHDLKEALFYVANKGDVIIVPKEKKKLEGKKTMWKFDQYYRGTKAEYMPPADLDSQFSTGDDDDIPF